MDFKKFQQKRKSHLTNLTFHCNKATASNNETNIFEMLNRKETIEKLCIEFQEILHQLERFDEHKIIQTIEQENLEALDQALMAISHLQTLLRDDQTMAFGANSTFRETSQTAIRSELKLPNINIPRFSGKYEDWLSFNSYFDSVIHSNPNLTNAQKFHYLRHYLSEEPLRLITKLDVTAVNYLPAYNLLKKRYENTRLLVNHHIKRIKNQPKLTLESASGIRKMIDITNESLSAIASLGVPVESWDPIIILELVEKLDQETRKGWEYHLNATTKLPKFKELNDYLEIRVRILEEIAPQQNNSTYLNRSREKPKAANVAAEKSNSCHKCLQDHWIYFCPEFNSLSICERQKYVFENQLCSNCLNNNHNQEECKSKYFCRVCKEKHNTLLHVNQISVQSDNDETSEQAENANFDENETNTASFIHNAAIPKNTLLATALVAIKSSSNETHVLKALIDQGSQATFITTSAKNLLNLPSTSVEIPIIGIGNNPAEKIRQLAPIKIQSLVDKSFTIEINALVMSTITKVRPPERASYASWSHLNGITLADPTCCKPGKIDLLLGADVFSQIILPGLIKGPTNSPIAQNTKLGWILSGPVDNPKPSVTPLAVNHTCIEIADELKRFWEIEDVNDHKSMSKEDIECENIFENTHRRAEDGRFIAKLPLIMNKDHPDFLGESRPAAISCLLQMEKRFEKNAELKKLYVDFMQEYLDLKHMEESKQTTSCIYYLPHHAVLKDSTTTKLRVVYNGSRKTSNGYSLNDRLLVGPKLQPDLDEILLRWQLYPYVFSADIEKMYRQIWIDPDDANLQRIVWRWNKNEPIKDYTLLTDTYGTASAAYLAIKSLVQHAKNNLQHYPRTAKAILRDFYVDNALSGAYTLNGAVDLQSEMIHVLKEAGFNLRKWAANVPELLQNIPEENRDIKFPISLNENDTVKTLGICWHPGHDTFSYKISFKDTTIEKPTKRQILSDISSLFDPLGWISPCIVLAKILLQQLWLVGVNWDDPLPNQITKQWLKLKKEMMSCENVKIPRWAKTTSPESFTLHGFSDASEHAYGAVVYIRNNENDKNAYVKILTSKTRVAPTKKLSIPRLELCGANLLCKLMLKVQNSLEMPNAHVSLWTDSKVALAWIQGNASKWKPFVSNRVSQIQEVYDPHHWHYVKSDHNPADVASRGCFPSKLVENEQWWHGPQWLSKSNTEWPVKNENFTTELEMRKQKNALSINLVEAAAAMNGNDFINRFSELTKLLRITAYCTRYINKLRKIHIETGPITAIEIRNALHRWCKLTQAAYFAKEYHSLSRSSEIKNKSSLIGLNPYFKDELIRVGGRLHNHHGNLDKKHPILLPGSGQLIVLIIRYYHKAALHAGIQLTLATIRQKFWIINGRSAIRKQIRSCITCFRQNCSTETQIMGQLPEFRVNKHLPFEFTGIDYAGPLTIKSSNLKKAASIKCYICIFVCLTTKAIHIELISDLSTDAFLAGLKRFISRRGFPQQIWSDNGTNFQGAKNEMPRLLSQAKSQQTEFIISTLANDFIEWKFIPPSSPHFGGIWESGVKSIKTHMKRVIGENKLTFEEMYTTLTQIEACLNSRPISTLKDDISDINYLTPGHFTIGRAPLTLPEPSVLDISIGRLTRWQLLQRMYQQFWSCWSRDYLHTLQQRNKWKKTKQNVEKNMIVVLKDENLPPSKWKLAKIIDTHPGLDGIVRVVTLQTQNNTIKRSINKICVLPIEDHTQNSIEKPLDGREYGENS